MRPRHLLAFALELLAPNDFGKINVQQPRLLSLQLVQGLAEGAAPRLERLRQPLSPLGPLQLMDDERRLRQHLAEIVPHECVEGLSERIGGSTALRQGGPIRLKSPAAHIVTNGVSLLQTI
jgi:hypothetical protein